MTYRGSRAVVSGDYKRQPDPDLPRLRADAVRRVRHRGDLRAAGVPPSAGRAGDRAAAGLGGLVPGAHACRRLLRAGQMPAADRAAAPGRVGPADLPAWRAGRDVRGLRAALGQRLGDLPAATAAAKQALAGAIVLAPPGAVADRWARRLADPVVAMASGWMRVRQRAKSRGVELPLVISDHADWDELNATIDEVAAPEVWVTHDAARNIRSVRNYDEQLAAAEALVLVYPAWWHGMPAMLKGYFDRVWLPGVAFDVTPDGRVQTDRLQRIRRIIVVTTYGGSWWLERIMLGDPARKIVSRAVRALCGRHCRVDWYAHYSMDRATPGQLNRFLDRVQVGMRRL
jgi:putative NADPH-quinone reductase